MLWGISLALPGFLPDTHGHALPGVYVLLLGLPFGWMVMGFAAYANLFFLRAAWLMLRGRQPRASIVAMLVLAATVPLFRGVMRDEGSGAILPTASWGWGAVLWGAALVLLATAAAVHAGRIRACGLRLLAGAGLVLLAALFGLHAWQWSRANLQERSLYLSPGLAFTLAPRCGVGLVPVSAPLLPPGSAVVLDIDPELAKPTGRRPELVLPMRLRQVRPGDAWRVLEDDPSMALTVQQRVPLGPEVPVVQARATADGAVLRLLASAQGRVLYEQPLRRLTTLSGRSVYCPMLTSPGHDGALRQGPDTELLKAIGTPRGSAPARLKEEVASMPCPVGTQDLDGIEGLREWDGRQVLLPASIRSRASFCSESYIALAYLGQQTTAPDRELSPVVTVFDRHSLRLLAWFNDRQTCRQGRCPEAPPGTATGVRIGDRQSAVITRSGEFVAQRL